MKRLGTFEGRAIVASEFAPENKYDIWYDATENQYKECIDGQWVKSPNISAPIEPYELPIASADTLGGIKVGEGLSIAEDGKLSTSGGGNEPLVVEGGWESAGNTFTPSEGQPSFEDVAAAFESGTLVLLHFGDGDTGTTITAQVISCGFDGTEMFLYAPFAIGVGDESKAYWAAMVV